MFPCDLALSLNGAVQVEKDCEAGQLVIIQKFFFFFFFHVSHNWCLILHIFSNSLCSTLLKVHFEKQKEPYLWFQHCTTAENKLAVYIWR